MCATYRAVPTKERVKDSGIKMRSLSKSALKSNGCVSVSSSLNFIKFFHLKV